MSIVSYSVESGIATIAMDDGKANALSNTMIEQLGAAFDKAGGEAKAVILAGREGKFCAGFDLKTMMQGPLAARELVKYGGELLLRIYEFPMPVVVACTGHAIAGGALLAATGDTRVGASGPFKIGLNEVQNGMPVPILAHEFARDRLLPTELFRSVVQATIYDPEGAVHAGWLDEVVDATAVMTRALEIARTLSALPVRAYAASKRSLRRTTIAHIRNTVDANMLELVPSVPGS